MDRRSRKVYVLWGISLAFLLALGVFCWLVVVPVWRTHRVVAEYGKPRATKDDKAEVFIKMLGGSEQAARKLSAYLRVPGIPEASRGNAAWLLARCGDTAHPELKRLLKDKNLTVWMAAHVGLGLKPDFTKPWSAYVVDPDDEIVVEFYGKPERQRSK